jgi:hypothetical protein
MIRLAMYNGFDWYGRILEVREVREVRTILASRHL